MNDFARPVAATWAVRILGNAAVIRVRSHQDAFGRIFGDAAVIVMKSHAAAASNLWSAAGQGGGV